MTGSPVGSGRWRLRRGRPLRRGAHSIPVMGLNAFGVEPMTGIEPAYLAWEASALPLSYIGATPRGVADSITGGRYGRSRVMNTLHGSSTYPANGAHSTKPCRAYSLRAASNGGLLPVSRLMRR